MENVVTKLSQSDGIDSTKIQETAEAGSLNFYVILHMYKLIVLHRHLPFDNLLKTKAWCCCGTSDKLVAELLFGSRGVKAALLWKLIVKACDITLSRLTGEFQRMALYGT
jgi:hypothetical protein